MMPLHFQRGRIFSVYLSIPDVFLSENLGAVSVSDYFTDLDGNEVKCHNMEKIGSIRCYAGISDLSIQVSAVFTDGADVDFPEVTKELVVQLRNSALDCK